MKLNNRYKHGAHRHQLLSSTMKPFSPLFLTLLKTKLNYQSKTMITKL